MLGIHKLPSFCLCKALFDPGGDVLFFGQHPGRLSP
jgi:hypothetical protein